MNNQSPTVFVDAHCHAFTLNHPSLTAFISRLFSESLQWTDRGGFRRWLWLQALPSLAFVLLIVALTHRVSADIHAILSGGYYILWMVVCVAAGVLTALDYIAFTTRAMEYSWRPLLIRFVPLFVAALLLWPEKGMPAWFGGEAVMRVATVIVALIVVLAAGWITIGYGRPAGQFSGMIAWIGGILVLPGAFGAHVLSRQPFPLLVHGVGLGVMFLIVVCIGAVVGFAFHAGKKMATRILNMLAFMENPIGSQFLEIENDVREIMRKNELVLGKRHYQRIILTPLMMDFGMKAKHKWNIHYSVLARKPIELQVLDMLRGLRHYHERSHNKHLLEIYPFMGLNTAKYDLVRTDERNSLMKMLPKYFSEFPVSRECIREALQNTITEEIEKIIGPVFTGIKVYPPLGFDPWPGDAAELTKVKYLYQYCVDHKIPIVTHCGGSGFQTVNDEKRRLFTSPTRWHDVLREYADLRINFAHFGGAERDPSGMFWRDIIRDYILEKDENGRYRHPNVYTDFAIACTDPAFDVKFSAFLATTADADLEQLKSHIIFGSDFFMCLFSLDSYGEYLRRYLNPKSCISTEDRDRYASTNPLEFLFGGTATNPQSTAVPADGMLLHQDASHG